MAFSGSQQQLLSDVVSWCAIAGMLFYVGTHFDDVRAYVADRTGHAKSVTSTSTVKAEPKPADEPKSNGGVELVADRSGQFAATIEINGRRIESLVDTGATLVALTYEDAERAGIYPRDSDFTEQARTANGIAKFAPVILERVAIGPILVRNVKATVAQRGRLHISLLGMSFLQKLSTFEIRSGRLVLKD